MALSERLELAQWIAIFVAQWAHVEGMLAQQFACFEKAALPNNGREVLSAIKVFESHTSVDKKLKCLFDSCTTACEKTEERDRYTNAILKLRTLTKERNDIVHGRWGLSEAYPSALINLPKMSEPERTYIYELKDFQELGQRLSLIETEIGRSFEDGFQSEIMYDLDFGQSHLSVRVTKKTSSAAS